MFTGNTISTSFCAIKACSRSVASSRNVGSSERSNRLIAARASRQALGPSAKKEFSVGSNPPQPLQILPRLIKTATAEGRDPRLAKLRDLVRAELKVTPTERGIRK